MRIAEDQKNVFRDPVRRPEQARKAYIQQRSRNINPEET